ncbi:hypothetical protein FSP39_020840 [Pinctada imbricata]|uniref:Cilia- and flagella-associated protein 52 n=1 Tax=Pinctada imbricata TaxID=66713 RepID=A0AA88XTH3_PINIB|nr:hypothetical protein FSP39_020840 [Pinctada imbricata]
MAETDAPIDVPRLELETVIGFNGVVPNGLRVHPGKQHIIYPLGCTVVIENISTRKQDFLWGHTNNVSCLTVSPSGRFLASGQVTYMGFKADIIIWDFDAKALYARLVLHKVKIQDLAFSPNDLYLVSLGGQDDSSVVVWDVHSKEAICGHQAQVESAGTTYCLAYSNINDNVFVTGGDGTLRVWELNREDRKIRATDVTMGQLKRVVKCIQMADNFSEPFFFCGTTTGDIIGVNMNTKFFQFLGPEKEKFSLGVETLALIKSGQLLVGAGDGEVALVQFFNKVDKDSKNKKAKICFEKKRSWRDKKTKKQSAVTSIGLRGDGHQFYVGSANSQIYRFNFAEFNADPSPKLNPNQGAVLVKTCHSNDIKDIVFPFGCSELIATAQYQEIRIWDMKNKMELRRQVVPNMTCNSIAITRDGSMVISAWEDGKIRGYGISMSSPTLPERFVQTEAHSKGVTAIAVMTKTSKCNANDLEPGTYIVSGGGEGQVRIWKVEKFYDNKGKDSYKLNLLHTMMEHKGQVSDIKINSADNECVTSSTDGTCIIWDLVKQTRKQIVFSNTLFKAVCYGGYQDCQIITGGTDRKLGYWEVLEGKLIRDLEGAKSGSINAIDISRDGNFVVTGGDEKLLKLWSYNEGAVLFIGIGHSAPITKAKICPRGQTIISVGADGAILIWKYPDVGCQQLQY